MAPDCIIRHPVLCQNSDSHDIPKRQPTALGDVANTDTKLLICNLFQKSRVLAQEGEPESPTSPPTRPRTEARHKSMTIETARRASLEFVCVFGQDAFPLSPWANPPSIEGKCHEQPEVVLTRAMSRKWRRSDADL